MKKRKITVRKHKRRKPTGGYTEVREHDRTVQTKLENYKNIEKEIRGDLEFGDYINELMEDRIKKDLETQGNHLNLQANYYEMDFPFKFDGVVTDIPFKGALKGKLGEEHFVAKDFLKKTYEDTKDENAFLITHTNLENLLDLSNAAEELEEDSDYCWKLWTVQAWDYRPQGSWISWSKPRRHLGYIAYFIKGKKSRYGNPNYPTGTKVFDFRRNLVKESYKRSGNKLKDFEDYEGDYSYPMYHQLVPAYHPESYLGTRINADEKIHPTQKPDFFSKMSEDLVSTKKLNDSGSEMITIDDKVVLDPYGGSTALTKTFENAVNIDIKNWGEKYKRVEPNSKECKQLLNDFEQQIDDHIEEEKSIRISNKE